MIGKRYLLMLWLTVICVVFACKKDDDPQLKISDSELVFDNFETKSLCLFVEPFKKCFYQITSYPEWLEISPLGGTISTEGIHEMKITPIFNITQHGVFEGDIRIYSTLGEKIVHVKGMVGDIVHSAFPDSLEIAAFLTSKQFAIENKGNVDFSYSLEAGNDYISIVQNASGKIPVNEKKEVEITIHREKMTESKDYESALYLKVNDKIDTIKVLIHHFVERKIHLESNVIDAEYSRKREMMVYAATNPMKLYFYHTKTNVIESLDLNFMPTCVSIAPNQDYAIVGHDAHISYIDLNSKSVIRTYNVSCKVIDIVFGDNNWAYAVPKYDSDWEHIRCINLNLSNDNETLSSGESFYYDIQAKLQPGKKYIYAALEYGDMYKYDIQNGTAAYLYRRSCDTRNNFWFSEDGNRIFAYNKKVYFTSESQNQDVQYNGEIPLNDDNYYYSKIIGLDHSAKKSNLYILASFSSWSDGSSEPFVYIHDASNLTYKKQIALEKYYVGNNPANMKEYNAIPYFVFSNSDGGEVVVITKANGSGLEYEWGIEKIIINN